MEFRARLALVNAKAGLPNVVSMKLEPLTASAMDAGWLFEHLGEELVVDLSVPPAVLTPLEEAISDAVNGR